jgi:hypothetical protein
MPRKSSSPHSHEWLPGASSPGSVVAEIGGDHGALIVHVPAGWHGVEIEIRRSSQPWVGTHVAVMARRLAPGDDHSAFFPSLPAGRYELRRMGHSALGPDSQVVAVSIAGGEVTDIVWTTPTAPEALDARTSQLTHSSV